MQVKSPVEKPCEPSVLLAWLTLVWCFEARPWWSETAPSSGCSRLCNPPAAAARCGRTSSHAAARPRSQRETLAEGRRSKNRLNVMLNIFLFKLRWTAELHKTKLTTFWTISNNVGIDIVKWVLGLNDSEAQSSLICYITQMQKTININVCHVNHFFRLKLFDDLMHVLKKHLDHGQAAVISILH